jgi:hypothetical protein
MSLWTNVKQELVKLVTIVSEKYSEHIALGLFGFALIIAGMVGLKVLQVVGHFLF